jgi:hypothetical protein
MSEPVEAPLSVPKRTTPTWEVELLISGALVISLFQLIDPLELWFSKWIALVASNREPLVIYSYIYSKVVLFVLIGTFVLHIAARAAWVALVGVHTIYPAGPRWENLSGGVLTRRVVQRMCGGIDDAVERADNRATLIFGYGILAAQFSFGVLVLTLLAVGASVMLERVMDARWALFGAVGVLTLPIGLFSAADWLLGRRLREGSGPSRFLERGLEFSIRMNLGRFTQPLLPLVTTNVGGRRGSWLLMLIFALMCSAAALDSLGRWDGFSLLRDQAFPPQTLSSGVNALHYAALRSDSQRFDPAPYIPAEVIEGAYLRLFIPYASGRHDQALRQECAAAMSAADIPIRPQGTDATAVAQHDQAQRRVEAEVMACFARLLQLRLDGAPLAQQRLERHRDPVSGQDGALAMIDVRALAPGRHELEIQRPPRAGNSLRLQAGPALPPDRIVFWR